MTYATHAAAAAAATARAAAEVEALYSALRATPEYARWVAADREMGRLLTLRDKAMKRGKREDGDYVQEIAVSRHQASIDALREEWLAADADYQPLYEAYAAERMRILRTARQR